MNLKIKNILFVSGLIMILLHYSCNDYLDVLPDNRAQLDTDEKIAQLLVSAYSPRLFIYATETSSDNTDRRDNGMSSVSEEHEDLFYWRDVTSTTGNDGIEAFWSRTYMAIASANHAIMAIDELGDPERFNAHLGEALMCRAYNHFMLVNVFAKHYSTVTGETDLGIAYADKPETTVNPYYERLPVAEVYRRIEADLLKGLELIDDNLYTAPKYHFNRRAAQAFAARFYLFYKKYDKVIEYSTQVLGERPERELRKMQEFASLPTGAQDRAKFYAKPEHSCNLLITSAVSAACTYFGNYNTGKKFLHSLLISASETTRSTTPWDTYKESTYYQAPGSYTPGYVFTPKNPYYFEYTDLVARIGYTRTISVAFHTDETLLCRAEAYIWQQQYDKATEDLNHWAKAHTTSTAVMTPDSINNFYKNMEYYRPDDPTPKKRLNPESPFVSELQENMMHCLLHVRRIETIHEGLRWFDVKRYGIVIYRRHLNENDNIAVTDELTVDDERRAIQLPINVISAGMTPNPRKLK